MKHKTYIAALLAGMLALAGCGGGGTGTGDGDDEKQTASDCTAQEMFNETTEMCEDKAPVAPTSKLPAGVTKVGLNSPAIGQKLMSAPRNNRTEDKFLVFGKTDEPKTWAEALGATSRTVYKKLGDGIVIPANRETGPAVPISGNAARIKLGTVNNDQADNRFTSAIMEADDSGDSIMLAVVSDGQNDDIDSRMIGGEHGNSVPNDPNTGIKIPHKGIPGKLICGSTGCGVSYSIDKTNPTADDKLNVYGTFTGDWYFVADAAAQGKEWVSNPKGGYLDRTGGAHAYAEWGYWLGGTGSERTLQRYWKSGGGIPELRSYVVFNAGKTSGRLAADGNTATYNGTAFGVSSTKDADGEQTGVGSFEATASLTATFGVSPKLKGTIDRFTGDAVGTWSLELTEAGITTGREANGSTNGGKDAKSTGVWSAEVYGETGKRPTGVVGGFTGHFSDGDASGVFHATPGS